MTKVKHKLAPFEEMSYKHPDEMLALMPQLPECDLTFAAEFAGKNIIAAKSVPVLLELLKHESGIVREGALLGLQHHLNYPGVYEAIEVTSRTNKSHAVQSVAMELLREADEED